MMRTCPIYTFPLNGCALCSSDDDLRGGLLRARDSLEQVGHWGQAAPTRHGGNQPIMTVCAVQSCMWICSYHVIYPDAKMTSVQIQSCHLSRCNHVICPDAITSSIQMISWPLCKYNHVIYPDAVMTSIQMQLYHLPRCNHVNSPDAIMLSIQM